MSTKSQKSCDLPNIEHKREYIVEHNRVNLEKKSVSFFAVGGGDSVTNGKMQERELEGIDTQNRKVVDDLFYHDRKCKNNVGRVSCSTCLADGISPKATQHLAILT